jgi:hypothetical protein
MQAYTAAAAAALSLAGGASTRSCCFEPFLWCKCIQLLLPLLLLLLCASPL